MGDAMIGSAILVHGPSKSVRADVLAVSNVEPGVFGGSATPRTGELVLPLWFAPM